MLQSLFRSQTSFSRLDLLSPAMALRILSPKHYNWSHVFSPFIEYKFLKVKIDILSRQIPYRAWSNSFHTTSMK